MNLQDFAKEILPVVQAAAEGKQTQFFDNFDKKWSDMIADRINFCSSNEYRIKPEPKLRPYTREEFIEKCLGKPLCANQSVHARAVVVPVRLHSDGEWDLGPNGCRWDLSDALNKFTHTDGSPCGVEVTE